MADVEKVTEKLEEVSVRTKAEGEQKEGSVRTKAEGEQKMEERAQREKRGLPQELRERVKEKYAAKSVNLMVRYNKLGSQFADFSNNVAFLSRCANMSMVPSTHRVYNGNVRNTRIVVRLLDQCSYRLMISDLEHNRRRKFQVRKNRERVEGRLKEIMNAEDFDEVRKLCEDNKERHFTEIKERQRKQFEELMTEYKSNERSRRRTDSRITDSTPGATPEPGTEGQGDVKEISPIH